MTRTHLEPWEKPIVGLLIVLSIGPFLLWRAYLAFRWRIWAGRIYLTK